jgi:hypothetical protein
VAADDVAAAADAAARKVEVQLWIAGYRARSAGAAQAALTYVATGQDLAAAVASGAKAVVAAMSSAAGAVLGGGNGGSGSSSEGAGEVDVEKRRGEAKA